MDQLTPHQVHLLSDGAYKEKGGNSTVLKDQLGLSVPFLDLNPSHSKFSAPPLATSTP